MATMWATKTDAAYGMLRREILDGTLEPGSAIDQEVVARRLGLSTTPLREALRRLEAEGLLSQAAHREVRVPPLSRKELLDIYDVRLQLDPYAAKLGAVHASDDVRDRVAALREFRPGASLMEMVDQHKAVHRLMYAAAGNQPLTDLLDLLWDRSGRYLAIVMQNASASGLRFEDYRSTLDAFIAGKGSEVARYMKASLVESRDTVAAHLAG